MLYNHLPVVIRSIRMYNILLHKDISIILYNTCISLTLGINLVLILRVLGNYYSKESHVKKLIKFGTGGGTGC